jgi:hypothetical protein
MRDPYKYVLSLGAALASAAILWMISGGLQAQSGGGFPSRPQFQSLRVGLGQPDPGANNATINGTLLVGGTTGSGNTTINGTLTGSTINAITGTYTGGFSAASITSGGQGVCLTNGSGCALGRGAAGIVTQTAGGCTVTQNVANIASCTRPAAGEATINFTNTLTHNAVCTATFVTSTQSFSLNNVLLFPGAGAPTNTTIEAVDSTAPYDGYEVQVICF